MISRKKIEQELALFCILTLFLTLFLCAFSLYERLILGFPNSWMDFAYNLLEGSILAKIILLGRALQLGERFQKPPLILPVAYKAVVFTGFVALFTFFEHKVVAWVTGRPFEGHPDLAAVWGRIPLCMIVFLFLFTFLEMGKIIGERRFLRLFFTSNPGDS